MILEVLQHFLAIPGARRTEHPPPSDGISCPSLWFHPSIDVDYNSTLGYDHVERGIRSSLLLYDGLPLPPKSTPIFMPERCLFFNGGGVSLWWKNSGQDHFLPPTAFFAKK